MELLRLPCRWRCHRSNGDRAAFQSYLPSDRIKRLRVVHREHSSGTDSREKIGASVGHTLNQAPPCRNRQAGFPRSMRMPVSEARRSGSPSSGLSARSRIDVPGLPWPNAPGPPPSLPDGRNVGSPPVRVRSRSRFPMSGAATRTGAFICLVIICRSSPTYLLFVQCPVRLPAKGPAFSGLSGLPAPRSSLPRNRVAIA